MVQAEADNWRWLASPSIYHISQSAEQIQNIKAIRKYRTEQQSDTAEDAAGSYDICDLFFHLIT